MIGIGNDRNKSNNDMCISFLGIPWEKNPRRGDSTKIYFLVVLEDVKSKIKVSPKASLLGLKMTSFLLHICTSFPQYMYIPSASLCAQISPSYKDTTILD